MKKFLKPLFVLAVSMIMLFSLTGCGKEKHVFTVYADGNFISQPLIDAFTEETGIEVNYITGTRTPEAFETTLFADTSVQTAESAINEALSGGGDSSAETDPYDDPYQGMSLVEILQSTRTASEERAREEAEKQGDTSVGEIEYDPAVYDVILTSGPELGELVEADLLLPLDDSQLNNRKNISESFTGLSYDPEDKYTVTAFWETLGLLWNTRLVSEQQTSWSSLWDENYAGQILMPSNQRDALAVALLASGKNPNAYKEKTLNDALDKLEEQKSLVADYVDRDAFILMENGRAALYPCYSGDALNMMSENADLAFLIPSEGTCRITFGYAVAADSMYSEEAMSFINYMCSRTNLAKNAVYSMYSVTSDAAEDRLDENWRSNPLAYPAESVIKNTKILDTQSLENRELCTQRWKELLGIPEPTVEVTEE